jgi:hypothetical protein
MSWRERHQWFEAAFGKSWRSTVLGIAAIGLSLVLFGIGALLIAFESTRTMGVAISGQGLALLVAGIGLVWMREEQASGQTHESEEKRIQALEAELTQLRKFPSSPPPPS